LVHIILGWREFKFVQIKGQVLYKGEIITKMSKWGGVIKIFLLKNCWPRKTEIYMKAFWHSTKSSLL
jgi:hypothetical protein